MDNHDAMYAAAERLVTNMRDDGLSKGMFMRMMGCTTATAESLISKLERNGVVASGFWGALPLEFGWEPLSARVFKLKPECEACPRCGGALVEVAPIGSSTTKRFCPPCDCPAKSLDALILAEQAAIRELLERQTAVLSWHAGLQRSPFMGVALTPEQAAEEARFAAEARQQSLASVSSAVRAPAAAAVQSVPEQRDCSGCAK